MEEKRHPEIGDDDAYGHRDRRKQKPSGQVGDQQQPGSDDRGEGKQPPVVAAD
jgi:hypothetical protein